MILRAASSFINVERRNLGSRMKISVIIPVYNEEKLICQLQRSLMPIKDYCEIIFVDGGSKDKTVSMISKEFTVLHSPKGRAIQMNFGAKMSTGDVLLFLHCDSEIPETALEDIEYIMKDHQAGCFGIAFPSPHFLMKCCQFLSNQRVKYRKIMFGDQGIFIEKELFFKMDMFPELPIMEDFQFSLNLKMEGIKIGIAKHRICTSGRRFSGSNTEKLKLMWQMNRYRSLYRKGVSIEEISKRYPDVR